MLLQEESQHLHLSGVLPGLDSSALFSNFDIRSPLVCRCFSGTCDYYVIKGHKRDSYYRLTGFPPDFKFSKKKGPIVAAITVTNDAQSNVQSSDFGSPIAVVTVNSVTAPVFTTEQYQQILNLLNKALVTDSSVNSAGIDSCCLSVINAIPWY